MYARITIDTRKAERVLRETGRRIRKSNFRSIARGAAQLLRDDMRSSDVVPKYRKGPHHWFSRPGYKLKIKAGNLRKSHASMVFRRSKLMWVGPKYRSHSGSGETVGATYSTADGFYADMYIAKTGNDFMERARKKNESRVSARLKADAEQWIQDLVNKAHATP